jgi:pSer/pThr/pTyr-binding forkhead associated (FHA) protein
MSRSFQVDTTDLRLTTSDFAPMSMSLRPARPSLQSRQWSMVWQVLLKIETKSAELQLTLQVTNQLILGRYSDALNDPCLPVDLTPYGALAAGVSRHHAALYSALGGLHIRDLYSVNGSMLNGIRLNPNRLYKLQEGDTLQLGQLHASLHHVSPVR